MGLLIKNIYQYRSAGDIKSWLLWVLPQAVSIQALDFKINHDAFWGWVPGLKMAKDTGS